MFTLAGCMQGTTDPTVQWIQQHAIPLKTTDQGVPDTDLAPLKQIVGNASIIGLGEETHGTHEIIDLKARLTEFLISKMGFTTFVLENSWGPSQTVDQYINGGSKNINDVMHTGLFPSWQTQEYRTLLNWMRAYNADPTHTQKIHFLGMDCQTVSQSDFNTVERYIQKVDPRQAAYVQQRYASISQPETPYTLYGKIDASTKQRYQDQAQQVYDLLQAHQKIYRDHSSPQEAAFALQTARVIVEFTTYYNSNTPSEYAENFGQRDSFMADNVIWIHDHAAGNNPKLIVWAHDAHIADGSYYAYGPNMGNDLYNKYANSYLAIGTTLHQGSYRIYQATGTTTTKLPTPGWATYNYILGQTRFPLYMLDLRRVPQGTIDTWATGYTLDLYGLGGQNLSVKCRLDQWFDVMINIQNSTPAHTLSL
jgi:erythromycin esterase